MQHIDLKEMKKKLNIFIIAFLHNGARRGSALATAVVAAAANGSGKGFFFCRLEI